VLVAAGRVALLAIGHEQKYLDLGYTLTTSGCPPINGPVQKSRMTDPGRQHCPQTVHRELNAHSQQVQGFIDVENRQPLLALHMTRIFPPIEISYQNTPRSSVAQHKLPCLSLPFSLPRSEWSRLQALTESQLLKIFTGNDQAWVM
jgi:hypothetical protein